MDGAILVVAGDGWSDAADARALLLAHQVGVPKSWCSLNKCDMVDDPELIDLVESEVRELLRNMNLTVITRRSFVVPLSKH